MPVSTPNQHRDNAGVKFPPPLMYLAVYLTGVVLQRLIPLALLPSSLRPAGILLALAALLLVFPSLARFRRARTSPIPRRPTTALVIEGPYRFTRNPMYLGMLLLYVGVALSFGHVWPLLLTPIVVLLVRRMVIDREESYLIAKFGDEYRRYQSHVRRWL
jgi:protein-S-isoprenylcysteine O-methyltransferase Ste14